MRVIDLRGLVCPEPLIRMAGEIKKIESGETFEVLATDPGTLTDIPMWARNNNIEVIESKRENDIIKFTLRKP